MTPHELLASIKANKVYPKRNIPYTSMTECELADHIYDQFLSRPLPVRYMGRYGKEVIRPYLFEEDRTLMRAALVMAVDWAKRTNKTYDEQARLRTLATQQRAQRAAAEAEARRPKLPVVDLFS